MDEPTVIVVQIRIDEGIGGAGGVEETRSAEGRGGARQSSDHQPIPVGENLVVSAGLGARFPQREEMRARDGEAVFGDPIAVRIGSSIFALRRREAQAVMIELERPEAA